MHLFSLRSHAALAAAVSAGSGRRADTPAPLPPPHGVAPPPVPAISTLLPRGVLDDGASAWRADAVACSVPRGRGAAMLTRVVPPRAEHADVLALATTAQGHIPSTFAAVRHALQLGEWRGAAVGGGGTHGRAS